MTQDKLINSLNHYRKINTHKNLEKVGLTFNYNLFQDESLIPKKCKTNFKNKEFVCDETQFPNLEEVYNYEYINDENSYSLLTLWVQMLTSQGGYSVVKNTLRKYNIDFKSNDRYADLNDWVQELTSEEPAIEVY